jgi:predicted RNase H-like HicB family nuclease
MHLSIEYEHEEDGRWLAEVPELPGVLTYGVTAEEALAKAEALALRVLAERLEQGESRPQNRQAHRPYTFRFVAREGGKRGPLP